MLARLLYLNYLIPPAGDHAADSIVANLIKSKLTSLIQQQFEEETRDIRVK